MTIEKTNQLFSRFVDAEAANRAPPLALQPQKVMDTAQVSSAQMTGYYWRSL
jgi:hypothetical protein